MRVSRILAPILFVGLTGCGTVNNLKAHPEAVGMFCPTPFPMGGVTRSALLATLGPPFGFAGMSQGTAKIVKGDFKEGAEAWTTGAKLFCFGIGAWVDVPLSLVGDVVTLPLAYARMKAYPWAMSWGDQKPNVVPHDPSIVTPGDAPPDPAATNQKLPLLPTIPNAPEPTAQKEPKLNSP
jgi:uncharacterized protein YceK